MTKSRYNFLTRQADHLEKDRRFRFIQREREKDAIPDKVVTAFGREIEIPASVRNRLARRSDRRG